MRSACRAFCLPMADLTRRRASLLYYAGLALGVVALLVLGYGFFSRLAGSATTFVASPSITSTDDILQVEVRNATAVEGLAGRTRSFLRDAGYDVVEAGNYRQRGVPHSFVIDRVGNLEQAQQVARALGIGDDRVTQDIRDDLLLDATVVIGADYASLPPFKPEDE